MYIVAQFAKETKSNLMRGISSVHNIVGLLIILDIEGLRVHLSNQFDLLTDSDLNQMECLHIDKIIHRSLSCAIERVLFVPPFEKVGPYYMTMMTFFIQNDNCHHSKLKVTMFITR